MWRGERSSRVSTVRDVGEPHSTDQARCKASGSPSPGVGSFASPVAADIFSCASGPFNPAGMSTEMLAILPRLAAAFDRSTLLIDANQPDGENPATFCTASVTNHYVRIVHATSLDGRGYAFPTT
jgi:Beta-1,3-glucanase